MSLTGLPFDDIRELVANLPPMDKQAMLLATDRNSDLEKVFGEQKMQASLSEWLAAWSGKSPAVSRPMVALFAGTHQIHSHRVDANDEATIETVTRLAAGGGQVNQVCATQDIGLKVFDLALQYRVGDISAADALDEKGSAATIGFGMEAITGGVDLLGLAAFGQGSQIANRAMISHLFDPDLSEQDSLQTDHLLVSKVLAHHGSMPNDPLEILRRLGGREHSAILGAILAARVNHVPVILDGASAFVVFTILNRIAPGTCDHCRFASLPIIGLPQIIASRFSELAILSGLGSSGDGSLAAHAIGLVKSVAAIHANTVPQAG